MRRPGSILIWWGLVTLVLVFATRIPVSGTANAAAGSTVTLRDPNGKEIHLHVSERMAGGVLVFAATVRTIAGREYLDFPLDPAPAADGKTVFLPAPTGVTPGPSLLIPLGPIIPLPSPENQLTLPAGQLP